MEILGDILLNTIFNFSNHHNSNPQKKLYFLFLDLILKYDFLRDYILMDTEIKKGMLNTVFSYLTCFTHFKELFNSLQFLRNSISNIQFVIR